MKEILIDGETGKFMNLFVDWLGSLEVAKKKTRDLKNLRFMFFKKALENVQISEDEDNFFKKKEENSSFVLSLSKFFFYLLLFQVVFVPIISPQNEQNKNRARILKDKDKEMN